MLQSMTAELDEIGLSAWKHADKLQHVSMLLSTIVHMESNMWLFIMLVVDQLNLH